MTTRDFAGDTATRQASGQGLPGLRRRLRPGHAPAGQHPQRWQRAVSGLGRRLRGHAAPAGVGLALGLVALGPGLARGFLLSYDMVFGPAPPFSAALIGVSGGPARAVPSDAVIAVLARLLPADILQKVILLLIFVAACTGAAALLAAGWRQATGARPPLTACLVAGIYYAWNPYVAERLLIGQWALLLGYAGLPWVVRELVASPARIRPGRLLLTLIPAAVGGFAAMTVTGLAAIPVALASGRGAGRRRRLATVLGAMLLLSLPWLIPSMLVAVHTDPRGVDLFAARADTPFGRLGSLILLSGSWNDQTVPRGYGGAGAGVWLVVVACALAGYACRAGALSRLSLGGAGCPGRRGWQSLVAWRSRPDRPVWPGLGVAGALGLAVAAIGVSSPTRSALRALVAAWPGFAVFRDGQQFVAPLALTEAIGLAVAIAWVLERTTTALRRPRTEPAAVALAVLALIAPLLLLPGMAFGEFGRLRAVEYPADWLSARAEIDASPASGSVLLLPWGAYRRYAWNRDEAVYDPWTKLLGREVISDDGLQVGRQTLAPESPASVRMNRILAAVHGSLTPALEAAGVRFVVIDSGPLLRQPASGLAAAARLPGARTLVTSRDLAVLMLPGPG